MQFNRDVKGIYRYSWLFYFSSPFLPQSKLAYLWYSICFFDSVPSQALPIQSSWVLTNSCSLFHSMLCCDIWKARIEQILHTYISINLVARIQVKLVLGHYENINIHLCICLTEKFKQFARPFTVSALHTHSIHVYIVYIAYIEYFVAVRYFAILFHFIEQRFQFAARLLRDFFNKKVCNILLCRLQR